MNSIFDTLSLRRPIIDYISPPICEFAFSASGGPVIVLEDIHRKHGPTGLIVGGTGHHHLSWDAYPGALCYTVYKAVDELDPFGDYQIVAECITDTFFDGDDGIYRVTAITPDGETDPSEPVTLGEGGGGGTIGGTPLAWWAFEDVDFNYVVGFPYWNGSALDSVTGLPLTLQTENAGTETIAAQTFSGKIAFGLPLLTVGPGVGDHAELHRGAAALGAVNLVSGFAISFDLCHVNMGAPDLICFGQSVQHFALRDASNNLLGSMWLFISDFGTPIFAGIIDPYTIDAGQTIANTPDATSDGVRIVIQAADGTVLTNELYPTVPGKQHTEGLPTDYAIVTAVYEAATGQVKLYVDNVLVHTTAAAAPLTGICDHSEYEIFAYRNVGSGHTTGMFIDELSIWPFKLTAADASVLWKLGNGQTWPLV